MSDKVGDNKPAYRTNIDFETAAHNLAVRTADEIVAQRHRRNEEMSQNDRTISHEATDCGETQTLCGKVTYFENDKRKSDVPVLDSSLPKVCITIKCNKEKHKLEVNTHLSGHDIMKIIAGSVSVPLDRMKLIHKGKKVEGENVNDFLKDKAVFQAFGERAENDSGLDEKDISVLMKQLSVDRNSAIKALRKSGDLLDAMLELGSK